MCIESIDIVSIEKLLAHLIREEIGNNRKKKNEPHKMQCGLESLNDCERSPNRTNLRVNFTEKGEAVKERREKFLTAKYGSHQMSLIRKRLAVEMWLYDELQKLFDPPVSVWLNLAVSVFLFL